MEGDNPKVLKLLRETYLNRVKMIYIVMHSLIKYFSLSIQRLKLID